MKIAKIEQFFPRRRMRLVKITTDNGLVGWGRGNWDSGRGKEMRAKWESMSPERRAQMIQKFRSASSGERREMMGRFMRGGKD